MSLPIDPKTIDPDDVGQEQARLQMDHETAIEYVREACLEVGFGVPVEFSPSDLLNERVDAGRDPYYVLGACNPGVADKALDASAKRLGALFPCNMVIWEEEPGLQRVYHVSIMRIARLVGLAPDDDTWQSIVEETGGYVDACFDEIAADERATYPIEN
jgi:uncharacterized protein (DUF302 family)